MGRKPGIPDEVQQRSKIQRDMHVKHLLVVVLSETISLSQTCRELVSLDDLKALMDPTQYRKYIQQVVLPAI